METSDYFAQLRSQLTSFLFINADGLTVSRLGLSITLFFKQGYTQEKKQRILACYRRFREEFGTQLRFHRHELKGLKKYSPENITKVEEGILNQKKNQPSSWVVSDAKNLYEAPHYLMRYLDSDEDDGDDSSSYLSLVLPWDYLKEQEGMTRFMAWLDFLCDQLEPDWGDCGYCLVLPRDYHDYFPLEYQLALRYPSLQVNSTVHTTLDDYAHSIRSMNWITLLSKRFVNRLGGEIWIRKTLARYTDVVISPYSNGLMIRAGQYPDLTPLPGSVPESYFAINQLIRPIRVIPREGHSLHFYGDGHFDDVSTQAWYARYDREPLHITPLRAGNPARVSGFWRTDKLPNKQYFFAQGAIAFDIEGAESGTTLWHLVREAASIAE
ncbi:type VI immunity family protein [Photorhabdus sp. RM125S]|uniref:type VI immunity family protein n=1 Tax=Photorhabdus sp. RM125S TaxID=3342821 RepID=UPI0036DB09FE